jgi:hypothetical protein
MDLDHNGGGVLPRGSSQSIDHAVVVDAAVPQPWH